MRAMDVLERRHRYPLVLLLLFLAIWTALAIDPWYREDWLLENVLVFAGLPLLAWGYTRLRFSNLAYTLLFVFLVLHEIGAHHTYSEVPYQRWTEALFGSGLNDWMGWNRNHYDRLVHFLYGLLVTPAVVELLDAVARPRGPWRFLVPLFFMMGHSLFFEIVEMAAAIWFGGDLGVAYLGTQGDEWDAQKDMALATVGTVIALCVVLPLPRRGAAAPG